MLVAGAVAMLVATLAGIHARVRLLVDRAPPRLRSVLEHACARLLPPLFFLALAVGSLWIAHDLWAGEEESELLHLPYRPLRLFTVPGDGCCRNRLRGSGTVPEAVMTATPETGLIGVLVLLALLLLGMPIGVSLGLVGMCGLALTLGLEPALIKSGVILFETLSRYELGTLPLFLLMAHLCFAADASRDFFDAAARLLGHRRGGLAYASVAGCAGFGTINGSSLATTATIGLVALPEMRSRGYSDSLATGVVAAGGTLGR